MYVCGSHVLSEVRKEYLRHLKEIKVFWIMNIVPEYFLGAIS
jgi:hypothetical protein